MTSQDEKLNGTDAACTLEAIYIESRVAYPSERAALENISDSAEELTLEQWDVKFAILAADSVDAGLDIESY